MLFTSGEASWLWPDALRLYLPQSNAFFSLGRQQRLLCANKYSHVCIVGDFNFKKINWASMSSNESEEGMECKFLKSFNDCFLYQHITKPIRIRADTEPSLLDLILTDEESQVSEVRYLWPLGASDHSVITFKFNCYIDSVSTTNKYLIHKEDFEIMKDNLRQ